MMNFMEALQNESFSAAFSRSICGGSAVLAIKGFLLAATILITAHLFLIYIAQETK